MANPPTQRLKGKTSRAARGTVLSLGLRKFLEQIEKFRGRFQ